MQRKARHPTVAGPNRKLVIDEVKVNFKSSSAIRDRAGRQASRGYVQGDMPGMVDRGSLGEADLPYDLRPKVQGRARFAPCLKRQAGPCLVLLRFVHGHN